MNHIRQACHNKACFTPQASCLTVSIAKEAGVEDQAAPVKSIFHRCYDRLRFSDFVSPLKGPQFNGLKMGTQSNSAENSLGGKPLHSSTVFGSGGGGDG